MKREGARDGDPVPAVPAARPPLHLSGARLRAAFAAVAGGCEAVGGIERCIEALALKSRLYRESLLEQDPRTLERAALIQLVSFMPTVRRRCGRALGAGHAAQLLDAIAELLAGRADTGTTDARVAAFVSRLPAESGARWLRDCAAEVLHFCDPERYPLMTRWVWDAQANTGALREIWFGPDTDSRTLEVPDDYATFVSLREELAVFLSAAGCYRDLPWYVDLLLAQVYAEYLCAQGGTYLRTDFTSPEDPLQYTRRMLGLDGVHPLTGKLRTAPVDGAGCVLAEITD